MGILSDIFMGRNRPDYLADYSSVPIASPWADSSHLQRFVISEALGLELANLPLSRADAIQLSAVSRGRNLITGAISPLPLVALDKTGPLATQPTWLYRSDTPVPVSDRMRWTVDSLLFHGNALWAVQRGAAGQITDAAWVPHDEWNLDADGRIRVHGSPVDEREVIFFNGPDEGLLFTANKTIRRGLLIEENRTNQATNPVPMAVIRHTQQGQGGSGQALTQDDIDDLLDQWSAARRDPRGAIGYLPPELTMDTHGAPQGDMWDQASNANRRDIAGFLNMPTVLLDGTLDTSFTYQNGQDTKNRLYTETLPYYTQPIEARLSMDDVVPRGQRVRFDLTEQTAIPSTPTGAPVED